MTAEWRRDLPETPDFNELRNVHIIGMCGTAMGSLAAMLKQSGFRVRGSDAMAYPPMSTWLEARGLPIMEGYRPEDIAEDTDLVVVGNVARADNPQAVAATERGLPMLSMPEVLRTLIFPEKDIIAVTGTHGKTTTSSMAAWILACTGRDPSFFIGGVTRNFGSNFRLGGGRPFVIEGDEYDTAYFDKVPKFWHYPATAATINNIEYDHADIYPDIESIEAVFRRFADSIPEDGELWLNGDDPRAIACGVDTPARRGTFGLSRSCELQATDLRIDNGVVGRLFDRGEEIGIFRVPMPGDYNVRNFIGAAALCRFLGVPLRESMAAIESFSGVVKRQELKGEVNNVIVIDDFAHHPTAVRHALEAIRADYPDRRIWGVFEAKSNTSRRAVFQDEYPTAFQTADRVVLSPPWKNDNLPEEQKISIPRLVEDIEGLGKDVAMFHDVDAIVDHVAEAVEPGDVVVGLSGSSFGGFHDALLDALRSRFA